MEAENDFVSRLLATGEGGCHFFASCLLHLSPEELKACHLVHSTWDKVIEGVGEQQGTDEVEEEAG